MSLKAVVARKIFTGTGWREDSAVLMDGAHIVDVIETKAIQAHAIAAVETLPADVILAPGFIDVQVNGGGGALLNDTPDIATIRQICSAHRDAGGTTGLLPTLITDAPEKMAALASVADAAMRIPGVLGFHLEGPFLNPQRKGVHLELFIRRPTQDDVALMRVFGAHGTSVVTLAPEMADSATVRALTEAGVRVCAGHCEAPFEMMRDAADAGLTGITHLFNALAPLAGRAPGVIGAAFDDPRLYCGVIADGHHVAASNLRLAYRVKGEDRIMLVTDAMPTAASALTSFVLQGRTLKLVDGRLTAGPDTLGGAHLTMLEAVRRMTELTGCTLGSALTMASRTPAAFLGRTATHGQIATGFTADLVAFDTTRWHVHATWIGSARQDGAGRHSAQSGLA